MKRLLVAALAITGILAAGCFVRFGSLYTADGTSHFVGFATNLSKVDVVSASVKVDFYDSSNHLLDSQLVSPCTRTLQIGKDSPFEAVPNDGVVANHVQTTVQWLTLGHKTVADLDVENNIAVSTASGETHITGTIDANEDLKSVNVCAALLDANGNVVKVGKDSVGNINDGGTPDFDVGMTSDDTAAKFELWIDGLRGSDPTAPVVYGPKNISDFATDTGALNPTKDSGTDFSNPGNAFTDDGTFATTTTTTTNPAKVEVYYGYGASTLIPDGATITGIEVRPDLKVSSTSGSPSPTIEIALSGDSGSTWTTTPPTKTITSTSEKVLSFGGSSDDWGVDWNTSNYTQLSSTHFRVRVTFTGPDGTKFSLDSIPVIVYYTTS